MQLKGLCAMKRGPPPVAGPSVPIAGHRSRFGGITDQFPCRLSLPYGAFSSCLIVRSGKTDPVQLKVFFKQAPLAYKNGHFASSFLLLGMGFLQASKMQICLSKVPLRNPIYTGPVSFCTPKIVERRSQSPGLCA